MANSRKIIDDLKVEIQAKKKQRTSILSQLGLIDVQIDRYDDIIAKIDKEVLDLISPVNSSINTVKSAYDAVITSGCKTDLIWEKVDTWEQYVQGGIGDGSNSYLVEFKKYKVKKNDAVKEALPYFGIKYYRKPSNRDYGSFILADFYGNISSGSTVIAVTDDEGIPGNIQVDDFVTDSIDTPQIFKDTDLPKIVGFGTTQSVGVLTSLIGGITSGSTIFSHFGAGSLSGVATGMVLNKEGILQINSTIVGFGITTISIEYFTGGGILTSGILTCSSVILNKPAVETVEEDEFTVGIITTSPAIFISTSASGDANSQLFTVFRTGNLDDIDKDFNPFGDPNSPLKIGIIDNSTLGIGHSVFYDNSGEPNELKSYNPNKTYVDPTLDSRKDCLYRDDGTPRTNTKWDSENKQCIRRAEPDVGAGAAVYYTGTNQWPVKITPIVNNGSIVGYVTTYANLGDTITVPSSSGVTTGTTFGYVSVGPGGPCSSGTLNNLNSTINTANTNNQNIENQNSNSAASLIESTKALRRQRSEKEMYAWSLLQAASSLRQEIQILEEEFNALVKMDLGKYDN